MIRGLNSRGLNSIHPFALVVCFTFRLQRTCNRDLQWMNFSSTHWKHQDLVVMLKCFGLCQSENQKRIFWFSVSILPESLYTTELQLFGDRCFYTAACLQNDLTSYSENIPATMETRSTGFNFECSSPIEWDHLVSQIIFTGIWRKEKRFGELFDRSYIFHSVHLLKVYL